MEFLVGVVILVADIWAMVQTLQSPATTGTKVLWVLIIFFLPVVGLILWFLLGPKKSATSSHV